jgi:hypothetical protein
MLAVMLDVIIALSAGGCLAATKYAVCAGYDEPQSPTAPLLHGCFAIQLTTSAPSAPCDSPFMKSNAPCEQPVPRRLTATYAYPLSRKKAFGPDPAATYGSYVMTVGNFPSALGRYAT